MQRVNSTGILCTSVQRFSPCYNTDLLAWRDSEDLTCPLPSLRVETALRNRRHHRLSNSFIYIHVLINLPSTHVQHILLMMHALTQLVKFILYYALTKYSITLESNGACEPIACVAFRSVY